MKDPRLTEAKFPDKAANRAVAVAISDPSGKGDAKTAHVAAAGRGLVAAHILEIAFANGVRVREDAALADILAALDIDSPIPAEAVVAVADILARVYEADQAMAPSRLPQPQER